MSTIQFITMIVNYVAWYIFVFIAVMWMLVLFNYGEKFKVEKHKKPKKLPTVSILVPAHNEEKNIEMTLNSLLNLKYPKKLLEIIVIDDASTDRTAEIVKNFRGVKLISNKKNMGKAYSLNKALKIAKGEIIACIDADSFVERDILIKMVGDFEDPKVASVTPALKVFKPRTFLEKIQATEYLLNIFLRKSLDAIDAIHVTPGVFSLYRKKVLEEIGGFDEDNLTEDMEIALRIQNAGYKITNKLDAISYTLCPPNLRSLFKQRLRWYRGALQNTAKYKHMLFKPHYGNLGVFLLPFNFISIMAVIAIFLLMLWNFADSIWKFLWQMHLINWDFMIFFRDMKIDLENLMLNTMTTPTIFMLIGMLLGSYLLLKSFNVSQEKFRLHKLGYFTYLIIYPLIMMVFWFTAMICEIFRVKRKW